MVSELLDCSAAEPVDVLPAAACRAARPASVGRKRSDTFGILELPAPREGVDEAIGEARQCKGVGQEAETTAAPDAGECQPVGQCGGRFILPQNGQWQQPATDAVAARFYFDLASTGFRDRSSPILVAFPICDRLDGLILQTEPAPLGEILRQRHRPRSERFASDDSAFAKLSRMTMVTNSGNGSGAGVCQAGQSLASPTRTSKSRMAAG